jgi:Tfp pilus assembly protein PilO
MKKKKIIIILVLVFFALAYLGYTCVYKEHRDIASEKASYTITVNEIHSAFKQNDSLANAKYSDKTIEVRGKITNIDSVNQIITLDDMLLARYTKGEQLELKLQKTITLKGRVVGYDDILEEIQMDQCTLINN